MKAGDAKGVPVQMKWLNASEVWKPAPRLKIDSPCSGTNAAVKTRPSTSDRPYAALEITIPPYECPTRIFGPEMPSSTARTIATSPAIDNRPSVGVTVVNPSFWSPATTMSQPGGEAQAPWTRTIVGLVSELFARAVAGKTETISIAAMTIMSRSNRGLAEPRAGRWACRANEAFIQDLRGARLNRVYKGETDRDHIDGSWRVRNLMKALRTHEVSPAASERVHDVCHRAVRSVDSDPHRDHFRGRRSFSGAAWSWAREDARSRYAPAWARRSFAFCSTSWMASAPATHRWGGVAWLATCMRALASLAGSPVCLPPWLFHQACCCFLRSS